MKRSRALGRVALATLIALVAWYLHDPPWIANVTSGLRAWEQDREGAHFRWTSGRASFFIPAGPAEMILPLRAVYPSSDGRPVTVTISVDDRWLADLELTSPSEWAYPRLIPLPRPRTGRIHRRVELRVSRVVGFRNLGVQVGEPQFRP